MLSRGWLLIIPFFVTFYLTFAFFFYFLYFFFSFWLLPFFFYFLLFTIFFFLFIKQFSITFNLKATNPFFIWQCSEHLLHVSVLRHLNLIVEGNHLLLSSRAVFLTKWQWSNTFIQKSNYAVRLSFTITNNNAAGLGNGAEVLSFSGAVIFSLSSNYVGGVFYSVAVLSNSATRLPLTLVQ